MIGPLLAAFISGRDVATIDVEVTSVDRTSTTGNDCYANFRLGTDGNIYTNNSFTDNFNTTAGTWLDFGSAGDVWVEYTLNSGALNAHDPGAGRHQLNANVDFGCFENITGQTQTANFDLNFYDAASGGKLIAGPVTIALAAEEPLP